MPRPSERSEQESKLLKRFGSRLSRVRNARRLSQKELSASSGIDITTISRIEGGVISPSFVTVLSIVRALDIKFEWLLDNIDTDAVSESFTINGDGELSRLYLSNSPTEMTSTYILGASARIAEVGTDSDLRAIVADLFEKTEVLEKRIASVEMQPKDKS